MDIVAGGIPMQLGLFAGDCDNGSGVRALYSGLPLTKPLSYRLGGRNTRSVSSQSGKRFSALYIAPCMGFATAKGACFIFQAALRTAVPVRWES